MNFIEKFNLEGKVAVITGAAGLLGKEHAHALGEVNATVYVTDLDLKSCEKACKDIQKNCKSPKTQYIPLQMVTQDNQAFF